jgi:hypothetical protein
VYAYCALNNKFINIAIRRRALYCGVGGRNISEDEIFQTWEEVSA